MNNEMRMIKFPSIEQYRNVIKNLREHFSYIGKDDEGKAIFDENMVFPTIKFTGTPKGHGTNAGVTMNVSTGEIWAQSRENILSIEKDNAGFAFFVDSHKKSFRQMFEIITDKLGIYDGFVTIYGEWAGPGIQKGVGISKIPSKSLFLFDIKITGVDESVTWVEPDDFTSSIAHGEVPTFRDIDDSIYLMSDMDFYSIVIDLNNPEVAQNKLIELTEAVELDCPIGKYFGITEGNVGEGIVWRAKTGNDVIRFKVKGEKHSSSKVKKLASVDIDKVNSINEFVDYVVTENRLNQGIEQVFTTKNIQPDITSTGDFVKWVVGDVIKEEMDTLVESGLEPKEVSGAVSKKASLWFRTLLNSKF